MWLTSVEPAPRWRYLLYDLGRCWSQGQSGSSPVVTGIPARPGTREPDVDTTGFADSVRDSENQLQVQVYKPKVIGCTLCTLNTERVTRFSKRKRSSRALQCLCAEPTNCQSKCNCENSNSLEWLSQDGLGRSQKREPWFRLACCIRGAFARGGPCVRRLVSVMNPCAAFLEEARDQRKLTVGIPRTPSHLRFVGPTPIQRPRSRI